MDSGPAPSGASRNDEKIERNQQDNPTGKSLLIFRNRVKPRNKKYFAFAVGQISGMNLPVSPDKRGARDRHERAVGCGGREGALTNGAGAYGEVVWS
jgi:hypothetical protein